MTGQTKMRDSKGVAFGTHVLVVAPPGVVIQASSADGPVPALIFSSIEDMDAWRGGSPAPHGTLRACVEDALTVLGVKETSDRVAALLDVIARSPHVPHLKRLAAACSSRRTFFRLWAAEIPEPPARFLLRVRVLHALRVLAETRQPRIAATQAGFRHVDEFVEAHREIAPYG